MKKRANLRDVAQRAGVSVATVSRVMNTPARVSPETRTRVETAMSDLRFTPSAAARAINTGRTQTVAALLPTLANSTFARFAGGLEARLGAFGYSLVVATTGEDPEVELAKARQMLNIGAEAIIVTGASQSADFRSFVERHTVPTVSVSLFQEDAWLPTIGYDNQKAVRLALDHLRQLGHRDIAVVHGSKDNNDRTRVRLEALNQAEAAAKGDLSFRYFEAPFSVQGGAEATTRLLQQRGAETAVLAFTDVLASGVINCLHNNGLKVPQDFTVMGMEDLPSSASLYPSLTTVHLPVRRMGEQAAEALAQWLDHGMRPSHQELPIELAVRSSSAPVTG